MRIRTVIHEQNAVAGLTNRLLAPLVDKVLVSYAHSKRFFARAREVVITGNPIRKEFLLAQRTESLYRRFGLDPEKQTVLVFGGSHGSAALTTAVLRAKAAIAQNERLQVLLVTGDSGEERAIRAEFQRAGVENVVVRRYIERMGEAFALADLIVSRAGATTLARSPRAGNRPSSFRGSRRRWAPVENARVLDQERACTLVNEEDILGQGLVELIEQVIGDQEGLMQMAQNSMRLGKRQATTLILGEIITLAQGART